MKKIIRNWVNSASQVISKQAIELCKSSMHAMDEEYACFIAERIKPEKIRVVVDFGNGAVLLLDISR